MSDKRRFEIAIYLAFFALIMCAPLFCPDTVREVCELPSQWEPQGLVTIGYPANAGKPFSRRALKDVVRNLDDEP